MCGSNVLFAPATPLELTAGVRAGGVALIRFLAALDTLAAGLSGMGIVHGAWCMVLAVPTPCLQYA